MTELENQKSDESRAYLWVHDFGDDASAVTSMIGLEPTYIQVAGCPVPRAPTMIARVHRWVLDSPLTPDAHLDDHVEALLQLLEPHAEKVKAASETFKAGIYAVVYYHKDFNPGHGLSAHHVKLIASMNLSIDYDLYFLRGADASPEPEIEAI